MKTFLAHMVRANPPSEKGEDRIRVVCLSAEDMKGAEKELKKLIFKDEHFIGDRWISHAALYEIKEYNHIQILEWYREERDAKALAVKEAKEAAEFDEYLRLKEKYEGVTH
jgi:hypothetical protein